MVSLRAPVLAALLCCCPASAVAQSDIDVTGAWIAAAPPVARVNAGYLQLANNGTEPLILEGAESPRFAGIEMHRSEVRDGMNTMRREQALAVPPGQTLSFAPGGLHLMLFSGSPPPRAGESVPITLRFAGGRRVDVSAEVQQPDAGATMQAD